MEVWINVILILFTVGGITVLANYAEKEPRLRIVLFVAILGMNGLILIYVPIAAIAPAPNVETPTGTEIALAAIIALFTSGVSSLLLLRPIREWARRFFPRPVIKRFAYAMPDIITNSGEIEAYPTIDTSKPLSEFGGESLQTSIQRDLREDKPVEHAPDNVGFRPESMIHMWALILCLQFVGLQFISFFLVGGLSGVAEDIGVTYSDLIANFIPTLLIPLLGVGLFVRRNPREILGRVGIRPLTLEKAVISIGVSLGATFVLVMTVAIIGGIWAGLVSPETFEEQTQASEALANSVNSIGLAFLIALTAGIGEEIAFRGALQPIFGFWFTAIVFVLSHSQYTLTPATFIILIVAIGLGLIRKYFDTTTSIMTHFLYNLTLLLLSLAAQQIDGESWIHFLR